MIEYNNLFYLGFWDAKIVCFLSLLGCWLMYLSLRRASERYTKFKISNRGVVLFSLIFGWFLLLVSYLANMNITFYISSCIWMPYIAVRRNYSD